jgi:tetratricopeptide (TPR) repeat protein
MSRVAFFPDGQYVVVDSGQGSLRIYSTEPRRPRQPDETGADECELFLQLEDPNRDRASWLAVSPDGGRIVAASNDSQSIHVWNLTALRKGLVTLFQDSQLPELGLRPAHTPVESVAVVGESLLEPVAQARWSIVANSLRLIKEANDADAYCRRGMAWNELGVSDRALDDFTRALTLKANHAEAMYLRGLELYRRREWESALADFMRIRDVGEETALADLARMMHGKTLLQLDRVEDMMIEIDRLLALYPQDPQLFYQRALGHVYRGRYAAAVADLRLALEHGPTHDQALNNLAWIMVAGPPEWRDLERGLGFAQRAVTLAPHKGTYQNTLGVAYYRLGQYPEALAAFEKSLTAGKGQFDGYDLYFESMCYVRMNDLRKAQECFERADRWQKSTRLNVHELAELESFRQEAAEILSHR